MTPAERKKHNLRVKRCTDRKKEYGLKPVGNLFAHPSEFERIRKYVAGLPKTKKINKLLRSNQ